MGMGFTPPMLRGQCYGTPNYARCPEYHLCKSCQMCAHYSPHNALCTLCESAKPPGRAHCDHTKCTDEKQFLLIRLEELTRRPLWDQNADAKDVSYDHGEACFNNELERVVQGMKVGEWTGK